MTTREFIEKHYGTIGDVRRISSVLIDTKGNAYSYGYHYPLLFQVEGLDFVNVAGYSNTTARHINWARQACPHAIAVELPSRSSYQGEVSYTLGDMALLLNSELDYLVEKLSAKKRKDTRVYQDLSAQADRVRRDLQRIRSMMS